MDPASIDAMNAMGRDAVLAAARCCDYLLPNEEEACWLAQQTDATEAARAILTPVDVTGAGDSFAAAFLSELASTSDPVTALKAAVRFSGTKIQLAGTQPLELLGYSG
jgi:sugar/nucleoside kinase (ribokinase family)